MTTKFISRPSSDNVSWRIMFYGLFGIFQICICGLAAWTLSEVIHQGKEIARIEDHLSITPLTGVVGQQTNRPPSMIGAAIEKGNRP